MSNKSKRQKRRIEKSMESAFNALFDAEEAARDIMDEAEYRLGERREANKSLYGQIGLSEDEDPEMHIYHDLLLNLQDVVRRLDLTRQRLTNDEYDRKDEGWGD